MGELQTVIADRDTAMAAAHELLDDFLAVAVSNADAPDYGTLVLEATCEDNPFWYVHSIVSQMGDDALSRTVLVDWMHDLVPVLPTLSGMPGDDRTDEGSGMAEQLANFCMDAFDVRMVRPRRTLSCLMQGVAYLPGASISDLPTLLGEGGKVAIKTAASLMPDGASKGSLEGLMKRSDIDEILATEGAYLADRLSCLHSRMPFADPELGVPVGELLRTGYIVLVTLPETYDNSWQGEMEGDALMRLLRRQCLLSFLDMLPDSGAWRIDPVSDFKAPDMDVVGRRTCVLHKQGVRLGHLVTRTRVQKRIERRRELLLAGDADGLAAEFG